MSIDSKLISPFLIGLDAVFVVVVFVANARFQSYSALFFLSIFLDYIIFLFFFFFLTYLFYLPTSRLEGRLYEIMAKVLYRVHRLCKFNTLIMFSRSYTDPDSTYNHSDFCFSLQSFYCIWCNIFQCFI